MKKKSKLDMNKYLQVQQNALHMSRLQAQAQAQSQAQNHQNNMGVMNNVVVSMPMNLGSLNINQPFQGMIGNPFLNLYGLQPSHAVITIFLNNQKKHQLVLGKSDFENKFIYALADPTDLANEKLEIILISKNFQYAILERTLDDWKRSPEKKNTGS